MTFLACSLRVSKDLRVTVALIDGGVCGQAIQIAFALDVVNPNALGTLDDYVERTIIVRSVLASQVDKVLNAHRVLR